MEQKCTVVKRDKAETLEMVEKILESEKKRRAIQVERESCLTTDENAFDKALRGSKVFLKSRRKYR